MKNQATMDGNTAAAYISYAFTELSAVYPITPSSTMAEVVESWSAKGRENIFGEPVSVVNMQSEAGAAGALHGALKTGTLSTTYTASQGLLLMLPNMYKIAGELLPTVFHVASRALSTNALSIFGDHSDVMAARQTGFCMLSENSVQEVMDLSAVAHLASIEASLPFMTFFDGFRTSHEIQKIETIPYDKLSSWLNEDALEEFRKRGMNPNHPTVSGTAQNPDIHFQQRETVNQYYDAVPKIVKKYMDIVNDYRGTKYDLSTYHGAVDATEIIISMGSVASTIRQTVDYLNETGRKVGHLSVHLYRPFPVEQILKIIPKTVQKIAVLDRTKEPGSLAEPLLLDIQSVMYQHPNRPVVIGGRYGLGSKDVLPSHIQAIYNHLLKEVNEIKFRFTIGILDDATYLSLPKGRKLNLISKDIYQATFFGFGSDGTVGATKQAVKIIGDKTDLYTQAYFSYDSKKSGGLTKSYLRFGSKPIEAPYLIQDSDFIGCHNASYIHQYDLVKNLKVGGTFLLNTTWDKPRVLRLLPKKLKRQLAEKKANFFIINATEIAKEVGLDKRINTIMSSAFFELTKLMPQNESLKALKEEVELVYGSKSKEIVEKNIKAIEMTSTYLTKVDVPKEWLNLEKNKKEQENRIKLDYIKNILEPINRQEGDKLSVQTLIDHRMQDGSIPLGTAAFEKRGIALEVPKWVPDACTMCNECAFICPHAAIRPFLASDSEMHQAPDGFITREMKGADGLNYCIQVSLEDCTGCGLCVDVCPAKAKALIMKPYEEQKAEAINWAFAMTLEEKTNPIKKKTSLKGSQFEKPLLEFSGACAGCGETTYIKLLTQLYGDRMMIANATGCSSIWGASSPATPYTTNKAGQGPAWSNSLFEDNAEFGLGMYLANKKQRIDLKHTIEKVLDSKYSISTALKEAMTTWIEGIDVGEGSRERSDNLESCLLVEKQKLPLLENIYSKRDLFVKPSQWIIGGDGWAYDIGFGGIDHVLASGEDVNIFVMDNEEYANTGGQISKATPSSATIKLATKGKRTMKKDLGLMAMTYGGVYVAQVALNANPSQTIKAITEAQNYPGPSLIIGYVPCISHGIQGGMSEAITVTKAAVESGYWPLYRYNPEMKDKGKNPFRLDSKKINNDLLTDFFNYQSRFTSLSQIVSDDEIRLLQDKTKSEVIKKNNMYNEF